MSMQLPKVILDAIERAKAAINPEPLPPITDVTRGNVGPDPDGEWDFVHEREAKNDRKSLEEVRKDQAKKKKK